VKAKFCKLKCFPVYCIAIKHFFSSLLTYKQGLASTHFTVLHAYQSWPESPASAFVVAAHAASHVKTKFCELNVAKLFTTLQENILLPLY